MAKKEYYSLDTIKSAIIDYIGEQTVSKYATKDECVAARRGAEGALYAIEDAPTADVVKVVWCKDCDNSIRCEQFLYCTHFDRNVEEDDFCSYGG